MFQVSKKCIFVTVPSYQAYSNTLVFKCTFKMIIMANLSKKCPNNIDLSWFGLQKCFVQFVSHADRTAPQERVGLTGPEESPVWRDRDMNQHFC